MRDHMPRGSSQKIITAGVYAQCYGFFPFQVGPTKTGETLGVVRLGGHREAHETGWECAAREALEEASIHVTPIPPPTTYWVEVTDDGTFHEGAWEPSSSNEVAPIVVSTHKEEYMTPIYLGYSDDAPRPAGEAKALLLLRPRDIAQIVQGPVTLEHYLNLGGKAIFKESLPQQLLLQPFPHLRFLHTLLQLHPEIAQVNDDSFFEQYT